MPDGTPITGTPSARASSASRPPVVSTTRRAPAAPAASKQASVSSVLARVARAQHERLGRRPGLERVAAHHRDRPRGAVAERRDREVAADRRAAHAADHEPAGQVALAGCRRTARARARRRAGAAARGRRRASRCGSTAAMAVARRARSAHRTGSALHARFRARLTPRIDPRALSDHGVFADHRARRPPSRPARRARARPRAPARPAPPRSTAASAPTSTRSWSTERSTRASVPTEQWRPSTLCGPDVGAGEQAALVDQRAGLVARRQLEADAAGEQVPGGLQVALGRPDVDPVAGRVRSRTARRRPAAGTPRARTTPARPAGISASTTSRSST